MKCTYLIDGIEVEVKVLRECFSVLLNKTTKFFLDDDPRPIFANKEETGEWLPETDEWIIGRFKDISDPDSWGNLLKGVLA